MTTKAERPAAKPAPKPAPPAPQPAPGPAAPPQAALPAAPGPVRVQATLLAPVADDAELVQQFKRYVELKEKLLEDTDYIWSVRWQVGDQEDSKFFKKRAPAEKWNEGLKARGIEAELEKKIKKSGCMKLGKAFGISDWPLEEVLDRAAGTAYYKVRAEAPNGQYKERTGACDRLEKGKGKSSFDTIMATALTRAADRAIMALLGGETTAEEFEGVGGDDSPAPPPKAAAPAAPPKADTHTHPCQRCGAMWGPCSDQHGGVLADPGKHPMLCEPCYKSPGCFICGEDIAQADYTPGCVAPKFCQRCGKLGPEEQERLLKLNEHFTGKKPAKPETERGQYNRRLWAAANALYGKEKAEEMVNKAIVKRYQQGSLTGLTDEQFKELALGVEGYAKKQGAIQ